MAKKWKRKLTHFIALPILKLLFAVIWYSCKLKVRGEENFDELLATQQPFVPCYWHQRHIICTLYMIHKMGKRHKLGFLISPSADGQLAARLTRHWGGIPVMGSTTRTGARAMRDLFDMLVKQKVSTVITPDGPTGPPQEFKQGAVMLSQLSQAPMLPISYAVSKFWQLPSWDRFMIPKPFSMVVVTIGEPRQAPKGAKLDELEPLRLEMEQALIQLTKEAEQDLLNKAH